MIKKHKLVDAIHAGVFRAHEQFERLSDGVWMTDTDASKSEGFLVSHILRSVSCLMPRNETPILELPFDYIGKWTGSEGRGRPRSEIRSGRRVDIALLNAQEKPIHLIEVKLKWTKEAQKDIDKLVDLLLSFGSRQGGTLKSVFLSVYWQRKNQPTLETKMRQIASKLKTVHKGREGLMNLRFHHRVSGPMKRPRDAKEWEFGSHIIELSRKNRT